MPCKVRVVLSDENYNTSKALLDLLALVALLAMVDLVVLVVLVALVDLVALLATCGAPLGTRNQRLLRPPQVHEGPLSEDQPYSLFSTKFSPV